MRRPFEILVYLPFIILLAASIACERPSDLSVSDKSSSNTKQETASQPTSSKTTKESSDSSTKKQSTSSGLQGTQQFPSFADLVEVLQPSVVNISTTNVIKQRSPFQRGPGGPNDPFNEFFEKFFGGPGGGAPQEYKRQGLGSGFIITEDGYVVTNNHVIDKATDIDIILQSGDKYEAKVVGKDPKTDLAVLKFEPDQKLQTVKFGDSDNLRIGDWVIAIGNPFGLGYTVTAGIVSAKGRSLGFGAYDDFIQTDASLNPGNSGGPLFNLNGEVVGVNAAIASRAQGIGFAIPIDLAEFVIEQLKSGGKVVRGWLGIYVQKITPEIAASFDLKEDEGALVSDLAKDGPAEKAGIKRGDVIIEFDGKKVTDVSDLTNYSAETAPGTKVEVKVIEDGKTKTLTVTLGEFPDQKTKIESEINENLGIRVKQISPDIAKRFNLSQDKGIIISDIQQGSAASLAGLKLADIILKIDKSSISTLQDYSKALDKIKPGDTVLFQVIRGNNSLFVAVRVPEDKSEDQDK
ncbi:MAG: DegQ family serine endoprotease [Thermodesulfobacteriota bacterium]